MGLVMNFEHEEPLDDWWDGPTNGILDDYNPNRGRAPEPRSKATVNNRAMTGSIMQGPRPEQRDIDGSVVGGDGQEPHGWTTKYEDENGCLAVALDCGMCFIDVPRRDVLNGSYDTTCTTSHRSRVGNVIFADFKGAGQS